MPRLRRVDAVDEGVPRLGERRDGLAEGAGVPLDVERRRLGAHQRHVVEGRHQHTAVERVQVQVLLQLEVVGVGRLRAIAGERRAHALDAAQDAQIALQLYQDGAQLLADVTSASLIAGENTLEVMMKLPDSVSGSYRLELRYNGTLVDVQELANER